VDFQQLRQPFGGLGFGMAIGIETQVCNLRIQRLAYTGQVVQALLAVAAGQQRPGASMGQAWPWRDSGPVQKPAASSAAIVTAVRTMTQSSRRRSPQRTASIARELSASLG
jgi:hypothetical protein